MQTLSCPMCDWEDFSDDRDQARELIAAHLHWQHIGPRKFGSMPASAAAAQMLVAGFIDEMEFGAIMNDALFAAHQQLRLREPWWKLYFTKMTFVNLIFAAYGVFLGFLLATGNWLSATLFFTTQFGIAAFYIGRHERRRRHVRSELDASAEQLLNELRTS